MGCTCPSFPVFSPVPALGVVKIQQRLAFYEISSDAIKPCKGMSVLLVFLFHRDQLCKQYLNHDPKAETIP